jgi:hypothetical protein
MSYPWDRRKCAPLHALTLNGSRITRPWPSFLSQLPVGFQNHRDGFFEIGARFLERCAFRVGTGQFLDNAHVPFRRPNVWSFSISWLASSFSSSSFRTFGTKSAVGDSNRIGN